MKALVIDETVRDIEKRDIDVFEYYHKDIAKLFIDCPDDVNIGDKYIDGVFVKQEEPEVPTEPEVTE